MKKNTQELLEILKSTTKIETYLSEFPEVIPQIPLHTSLNKLISQKELVARRCIDDAGLGSSHIYEVLKGKKGLSRDKLIALCLAMHLTLEEVHILFCSTGYADLYAKNQRDSVLIFAFQKHLSVLETNEMLYDLDMEPLDLTKG